VANVQVAVGFGRKTGLNLASVFAFGQIVFYLLLNEVEALFFLPSCGFFYFHKFFTLFLFFLMQMYGFFSVF
jgi:hypothetical protein